LQGGGAKPIGPAPATSRATSHRCRKKRSQNQGEHLFVELKGIEIVEPSDVFAQLGRSCTRPESGLLE
jgi:hypothetical protein